MNLFFQPSITSLVTVQSTKHHVQLMNSFVCPCSKPRAIVPFAWAGGLLALSLQLSALPIITDISQTGGIETKPPKFTGQTFDHPNLGAGYTVPFFDENVAAFNDRVHQWNGATVTLPLPEYLVGGEYIMLANDNRGNDQKVTVVTISQPSLVYVLVDNRLPDGVNSTPPGIGTTPESNMGWLLIDGWAPVQNGLNRTGNPDIPDEVGVDEGAGGSGPGVSIDQWSSVYVKAIEAGTFTLYQANNAGRNMYGVVVKPIPDNPAVTSQSGDLFGVTFRISDGSLTSLDANSIELTVDDAVIPPQQFNVSREGPVTTIQYSAPEPFAPLSTHVASIAFSDNGTPPTAGGSTITFTIDYYAILTADMAVPASEVNLGDPGFRARVHQIQRDARWPGATLPATIARAETQLAGRLLNPDTGEPFPNIVYTFDFGYNPDGTFSRDVINWNQEAGPGGTGVSIGSFPNDEPIPGIPGDDPTIGGAEVNLDNIAAEIVAYLDLKAGIYQLGVNSDDGFKATAGHRDPRDPAGLLLGQFDGGRGAVDSLFYVRVEADGLYPVRLLWFEGGGGASVEFFSVDLNSGQKILINDLASPNAIRAYATPTVARPFVSVFPVPGSGNVPASAPVVARFFNQTASVNQGSIQLQVNGETVTHTVTPAPGGLTVSYQPALYLDSGATYTVTLSYTDTGNPARTVTTDWQFTVQDHANFPVLPAAFAVAPGTVDLNSSGFSIDSYHMGAPRTGFADNNNSEAAEHQLARLFLNPDTDQPYPNLFAPGSGPGGRHIREVVNWNQVAPANAGGFNLGNIRADDLIPGQAESGDIDWIVAEAVTYLELKQGLYQFGVNSDDGFKVSSGADFRDLFAPVLGIFNAGRGASDTLFSFFVEADGIYPFRLLWWEGTGGASCEFFVVDLASGARRLINDRENSAHFTVRGYSTSTGPARPYVKSISPAAGAILQPVDTPIEAVIANLGANPVELWVDGIQVTPTLVPTGADTLVQYTSATPYAAASTVSVTLVYDGVEATWTFTTADPPDVPVTGNIFLVTDRADLETDGTANLAGYLRLLGYQVDVSPSPDNASEFRGLLSADEIAQLEASDLVIVHRATSSGSFIGEEGAIQTQWNNLDVPLLLGSAYLARSTHWSWTAGAQTRSATVDLTFADSSHPIVAGMGTDLFTEPRDVDHLTTLDVGNGTLVATANEGVVLAVWDQAGLFRDEGIQSHPQRRVFFPIMRYHEADATAGIFGDYSANGLRLLANAVEYAMTGQVSSVPPQVRIVDLTLSASGFGLSIDTEPGKSYRIEIKGSLDEPEWGTLITLEGDGTRQTATDPVTEARRFYRVVIP
jgi:hypothetical protein